MTQAELARGVATKGYISLVERDLANCSLPKLRLLADRLGQPLSFFFPGAPPEDPALLAKTAELALKAGEPRRAMKEIESGLSGTLTANTRANLLRLRGIALMALGRWQRALKELQLAAAQVPADDPELTAEIYVELANVLGTQERYSASVETNLRALKALESCKHPDPDISARALTNLANDVYHLGQLEEATDYLRRALAIASDAESLTRMANAHMALGITARAGGDYAAALKHCDRALAMHRLLGHERVTNHILNNLGDVHFAAGRIQEAIRCQQACLDRGRQQNDPVATTAAATELARYALSQGRLEEATALAAEGEAAALRARDHLYQATAISIQATVAEHDGKRQQADGLFATALVMLHERRAAAKLADLCAAYSDLLMGRGEHERAHAFMRMAYARDFANLVAELPKSERTRD